MASSKPKHLELCRTTIIHLLSTFSTASRLPFSEFFWNYTYSTQRACVTNYVNLFAMVYNEGHFKWRK